MNKGGRLVARTREGKSIAGVVIAESGEDMLVHVTTGCGIGEVSALAKEGAEEMEYSKEAGVIDGAIICMGGARSIS